MASLAIIRQRPHRPGRQQTPEGTGTGSHAGDGWERDRNFRASTQAAERRESRGHYNYYIYVEALRAHARDVTCFS